MADEESIVGTEDAGIIAVDVVAPDLKTGISEPGHAEKDKA